MIISHFLFSRPIIDDWIQKGILPENGNVAIFQTPAQTHRAQVTAESVLKGLPIGPLKTVRLYEINIGGITREDRVITTFRLVGLSRGGEYSEGEVVIFDKWYKHVASKIPAEIREKFYKTKNAFDRLAVIDPSAFRAIEGFFRSELRSRKPGSLGHETGIARPAVDHPESQTLIPDTRKTSAKVWKVERTTYSRLERREATDRFQEKYAVVVDMNVFDVLSEEQQIEFKKLIHARSEVRFVFNMVGERQLDPALKELMEFRDRYKNVEIRIDPSSFDFQGRKVINVSKEGTQAPYADFIERRLGRSKDFHRVRYREGDKEAGLLTAALLLLESKSEDFIRQGRYFSKVPAGLKADIEQFLLTYIYVGRSA